MPRLAQTISQDPLAESSGSPLPIFDPKFLLERIDYDQELFQELCHLFLEQMPESLEKLFQATQEQNYTQIAFFAHLIKGRAGNMGAFHLQGLCEIVERSAKGKSDIELISTIIPKMETAYAELVTVL